MHQWLTLTENFLGAKGCPVFPFGYLFTQQPLTEHYSMPATVRGAVPAATKKTDEHSPFSCKLHPHERTDSEQVIHSKSGGKLGGDRF